MVNDHIIRQIKHWNAAADRLGDFALHGAEQPWESLEKYTNSSIREALEISHQRLLNKGKHLSSLLQQNHLNPKQAGKLLLDFKSDYLRTETMFDFYTDAINNRSGDKLSRMLRACDHIAWRAMNKLLQPLGHETPPVLTYIDKGLGASILKAGLRLWDQNTDNPVAMIKVVRHNLFRPTSLVHEAGHQVAHILDWNEELRQVLRQQLRNDSELLADVWSSWASEIAADVFAFVHTGYGSVASLHDVVAGSSRQVYRFIPGDPHPISYLRLLLAGAFCDITFGKGPWEDLVNNWRSEHRLDYADADVRDLVTQSEPSLRHIAKVCLQMPFETLGGKSMSERIPMENVMPSALAEGRVLNKYVDQRWVLRQDPLWLLAMSSWNIATDPRHQERFVHYQTQWMDMIGAYRPVFL